MTWARACAVPPCCGILVMVSGTSRVVLSIEGSSGESVVAVGSRSGRGRVLARSGEGAGHEGQRGKRAALRSRPGETRLTRRPTLASGVTGTTARLLRTARRIWAATFSGG